MRSTITFLAPVMASSAWLVQGHIANEIEIHDNCPDIKHVGNLTIVYRHAL